MEIYLGKRRPLFSSVSQLLALADWCPAPGGWDEEHLSETPSFYAIADSRYRYSLKIMMNFTILC
jgi:hypothetical protein